MCIFSRDLQEPLCSIPSFRGQHHVRRRADYCIPANAVFADNGKQRRKSQQSKGKPKKKRSLEAEQP
jgi:hypothetical protein